MHIELIARGAWFSGSSVLLCRSVGGEYYYLPGGHVEFGEPAAVALVREFEEETGLTVRACRLALVNEGVFATRKRPHHEINFVFYVERDGRGRDERPKVRSREAKIAFEWVDLAAVVDLDVRPLAIKAWLAAHVPAESGKEIEWVSSIPTAPDSLSSAR